MWQDSDSGQSKPITGMFKKKGICLGYVFLITSTYKGSTFHVSSHRPHKNTIVLQHTILKPSFFDHPDMRRTSAH